MVDFGHDYRSEDECKAGECPWCDFKQQLMQHISYAAGEAEHVWQKKVGQITDRLFDAVWAINRTRREGFTDEHDGIANAWEAADKLVAVYHSLDELAQEFDIQLHEREPE